MPLILRRSNCVSHLDSADPWRDKSTNSSARCSVRRQRTVRISEWINWTATISHLESFKRVLLVFPRLSPSCRVAGMTDDLPTPRRPVRLPTHSQSSTFHAVDTRLSILFLLVPVYPSSECVLHLSSSPVQSSLCDIFGSLGYFKLNVD